MQQIIDRFISYVTIDTQSDPGSPDTPSTNKQWDLAKKLSDELLKMGLEEVTLDEKSYVMASLPANVPGDIPTIGFIAHFDTSPDYSGKGVSPRVVEHYDGNQIILKQEPEIILSPDYFPELQQYKGQTLIVTDGTTLLGADDKAGITEIMEAMLYLKNHPEIAHGRIRICFTPDEEIGRGAHHFDVEKFGASWAYTMDGGAVGELEYENFNAASAKVTIQGRGVHPGHAKGKMVNAINVLYDFMSRMPRSEVPEKTWRREGFFHVHHVRGEIETAGMELIIRDHDQKRFETRKELLTAIAGDLTIEYGEIITLEIHDQYYNMKEKVVPVFHIVEIAAEAMKAVGIEPVVQPIRGGTDGSQLSFKGLPCPNIFAGGHNFHGKYEFIAAESMEKAVEVIVKICEITAEKYR